MRMVARKPVSSSTVTQLLMMENQWICAATNLITCCLHISKMTGQVLSPAYCLVLWRVGTYLAQHKLCLTKEDWAANEHLHFPGDSQIQGNCSMSSGTYRVHSTRLQ